MARASKTKKKRPSVSIIGMGRVGQAMADTLRAAGYPLVALVFHDSAGAEFCRSSFPQALLLTSEQLDQLPFSDLLLITTPDDAIAKTAQRVANLNPRRRRIVLHTSGALSSEVLSPLTKAGFFAGSMHPLVSVTHFPQGAAALRGASYCLEGHNRAVSLAREIVSDLEGESFHVQTEHKALYHAAAVIASPHLVALFDLALELLSISGMDQDNAGKLLLGLIESTVKNLHARPGFEGFRDPSWALTGTFARGDVGTVERHLKALSRGKPKPPREALELYELLGLRSLQLAKQHGLDPKKITQITKLLKASKPVSRRRRTGD